MKRQLINALKKIAKRIKFLYLSLGSSKECPICKWTGHSFSRCFLPNKPAVSRICPSCGSFERHRLAYFMLKGCLSNYSGRTLHLAPERCIEPWLRSISKEYLSIDLCSPNALLHMDITNLALDDNSFSLLWCSHIFEHIEDDGKAMKELFRVMKPNGLAIVMVPIYGETTYEDPSIILPAERLKHFKQKDHVRLYGRDIRKRLTGVGFNVKVLSVSDLPKDSVVRYMLEYPSTKEVFLCAKQKVGAK